MKLFVASDIHGSYDYALKMIENFNKENADKLVLLGDILYHGPRNDLPFGYNPKKVIELLNSYKDKILCVRGNCDAEVDQMVLNFSITDEYKIINDNGLTLFFTHGHHINEKSLPNLDSFYLLFNGHTHIPKFTRHENYIYLNTGSISIPKENSQNSFIVLENNVVYFKNLNGEIYLTEKIYN